MGPNIKIDFYPCRAVFRLQFGHDIVSVCPYQFRALIIAIYQDEPQLIQSALLLSLQLVSLSSFGIRKEVYHLQFRNRLIRVKHTEMLYFLSLVWSQYEGFMQPLLVTSEQGNKQTLVH